MVVNQQAQKNKKQRQWATSARPARVHWDIETASLSLRGDNITSQYKEQLKTQLRDKSLTNFIKE
jgi:hypothetical protein